MTPDQVADVLGTVATAGAIALVVVLVMALVAPARLAALRASLAGSGLALAAGVAIVAMVGSLWFSEGAHFPPCKLCWYQRIAMYPLAILLPIAAARRHQAFRLYACVLASVGLAVSAYHNLIETKPSLEGSSCDPDNPCTLRWVEGLGFWTIPRMAFVAFCLVLAALLLDPTPAEEP